MGLVAEPVLWLPDAVGLVPRWTVRVHPPFDAVTDLDSWWVSLSWSTIGIAIALPLRGGRVASKLFFGVGWSGMGDSE